MRLVLLGPPGSGKGTQGKALAEHFGITHVSSGDLLRENIENKTELGRRAATYMERGELVPDDLVVDIITEAVLAAAAAGGYVLDGFPRTLKQALRAYEIAKPAGVTADAVLYFDVSDEVVRERLKGRAVEGRPDDADDDVIQRRLDVFHRDVEPLLDYYRDRGILITIDAMKPPDEVTADTLKAVSHLPGD
jgi:adenylate kinase